MGSTEEIRKAITEALEEIRKHVGLKAAAQVELDKHDALLNEANSRYTSLCADLCASFVAEAEGKPTSVPSPQDRGMLTAPLTRDRIISHAIDKRALGWTWDEIAGSIGISRSALSGITSAAGIDPSLLRRNAGRSVLFEKGKEQQNLKDC